MDRAKVFMTGRSQAVRLPKAYRFDTDEVLIERLPDGALLLRRNVEKRLGDRLWEALGPQGLPDFERPPQGELERDAAWWDARGLTPAPRHSRKIAPKPTSKKPGR